ncbi:unnamed protein product [Toxocara canis]|uniref:Apple domain-containing protein n=1 Tax=Toxocara canis TaxID=6265 RepID=A0A183VGT9_TOXCA|nr:unnamed protein product [Toxocara canis]
MAPTKVISVKLTKQEVEKERILSPACPNGENDVWLSIENAVLETKGVQKSSSADSAHSCKTKCNLITNAGRDCPAVTFHEAERQCISYINNIEAVDTLRLEASPTNDFSTRTLVKFCYPGSLNAFKGCAEFTSFRDYTLELEPREEFDGMPKGYAGLQACLELCVLSPNFYCKSASFVLNEGRCLLRDQNSLSKADLFREHLNKNEIYFENGCEQFFTVPDQVQSEAQMVRIPLKSVLRSIRIQPQVSDDFDQSSS